MGSPCSQAWRAPAQPCTTGSADPQELLDSVPVPATEHTPPSSFFHGITAHGATSAGVTIWGGSNHLCRQKSPQKSLLRTPNTLGKTLVCCPQPSVQGSGTGY